MGDEGLLAAGMAGILRLQWRQSVARELDLQAAHKGNLKRARSLWQQWCNGMHERVNTEQEPLPERNSTSARMGEVHW